MDVDEVVARAMEPARRHFERIEALKTEVRNTELECTSRDRTVKVTQTLAGEVMKVEIKAGAFDSHDEASLSRLLTDVMRAAHSAAQQGARQLADEYLGARGVDGHG